MLGGSHDYLIPQQKSFQLEQEDKFISKLLTNEQPKPNGEASFRGLYYGKNSSAIPFMWESQPGTPKHPNSHSILPPLTPPPSYQFSPRANSTNRSPKSKFTFNIFKREMSSKKYYATPSSNSSSSTSSLSLSGSHSPCSDTTKLFVRHQRCCLGSSLLCFRVRSTRFCKEAKGSLPKLSKEFLV